MEKQMLKQMVFIFFSILFFCPFSLNFAQVGTKTEVQENENAEGKEKVDNNFLLDLEKILRNEILDSNEIANILEQVGNTRNVQFIPLVKDIAEKQIQEQTSPNFYALKCLQDLGESDNYFLTKAWYYESNPKRAFYSILVLSYFPSEEIYKSLKQLYEELNINKLDENAKGSILPEQFDKVILQSAIKRVFNVYEYLEELEGKDFRAKIDFLLDKIGPGGGCKDFYYHYRGITPNTFPEAVWAQKMLYILSLENAYLIVEIIEQKDILSVNEEWLKRYSKDFSVSNYRKYLSQFVSDEAKKLLLIVKVNSELNP